MAISFQRIPSNLRLHGWYFEVDTSQGGGRPGTVRPALMIGQRTSAGTVAANTLHRVSSASEAAEAHGQGSHVHRMVALYRKQDPFGELWTIGVADPGAGAPGTRAIVVTGPATAAGTLVLYIGGQRVEAAVANGDADTVIATALDAAINEANDLPVTSGLVVATLTLTGLNVGVIANEIDVRANYRGAAGGEAFPAGVGVTAGGISIETTPVRLAGGTGAPTMTTAIANLGDTEFDFIAVSFNDDTTMDLLEAELDDDTGRWSVLRGVYGHIFAASDAPASGGGGLTEQGNLRNSQHSTLLGIESCPAPTWEIAAALAGQVALARNADVAAVYHTLGLNGILAPRSTDLFIASERNTLLTDGITPTYVDAAGAVRLEDVVTTWQLNPSGVADETLLDVSTMFDLMHMHRRLRDHMSTKFGRHRAADDGTLFGPGKRLVTPSMVVAEVVGLFREWERDGIVEDFDTFVENLIVERNGSNPKRIDIRHTPNVTNALVTGAVQTGVIR